MGCAKEEPGELNRAVAKLEAELRDSREKLEIALSAAGMGLWTWDVDSDEFVWEAGSAALFKGRLDRMPRNYEESLALIHPEDRDRLHADARQTLSTGVFEENEHRIQVDGETRWMLMRGRAIHDAGGRVVRVIGGLVDITEQKRAQQDLGRLLAQEQKARRHAAFLAEAAEVLAGSLDFRTTLEALVRLAVPRLAGVAVVEACDDDVDLDPDGWGAVAATDPGLEQLYREARRRYSLSELSPAPELVRSTSPRLFTPQDSVGAAPADAAQDQDLPALRARLWQRYMLVVPLSARGARRGVLILGDSARALGPEDLELAADLGRVAALAIDNAILYHQIQAAARVREEFLSIASHELRTPLTPVMLNLQRILRAEGEDASIDWIFSKLKSTSHQLDRLHRLIEELLDISRVTSGRLRLELEEMDLAALVAEVAERLSDQLRRAGCRLTLDLPAGARGRWDRLRLEQAVDNLLTNAMKYGTGKPIEVRLEADDAVARLSVRDHGIGIAPRDQERIFQRFERAVSDRHYGGFGLGLWISRQVVEAMGGTIRVSSRLGEGSTFTIELPRVMQAEQASQAPQFRA